MQIIFQDSYHLLTFCSHWKLWYQSQKVRY